MLENGKKDLIIYGFTGSVGLKAIELYKNYKDSFNLKALVCKSSFKNALQLAVELNPDYLIFSDTNIEQNIETKDYPFKILYGEENALSLVKELENGVLVISSLGISGLEPAYYGLKGKNNIVALANKESIVCAGDFLPNFAKNSSSVLIPVDSEHSAIYQIIKDLKNKDDILNVYLTASGGPFVDFSLKELEKVTKKDALKHPVWNMGSKISIDSASLMNKGLEHIEACYLFNLKAEGVKALVHRQSTVHGMVALKDGSLLMHASKPDMYYPISYAMLYPRRDNGLNEDGANFLINNNLSFEELDKDKFKCYGLAFSALKQSKSHVCALNHANDYLVKLFLEEKVSFLDLYNFNNDFLQSLNICEGTNFTNLESILELNKDLKQKALAFINKNLNI